MVQDKVEIRLSRRRLITGAIITGLTGVLSIITCFESWQELGFLGISAGVLSLAGFIYYIKELKYRKIEIVISPEGISLRGKGHYAWSLIESFSTRELEDGMELVLHMEKNADVDLEITSLEQRSRN
jgi:hypothetical protein